MTKYIDNEEIYKDLKRFIERFSIDELKVISFALFKVDIFESSRKLLVFYVIKALKFYNLCPDENFLLKVSNNLLTFSSYRESELMSVHYFLRLLLDSSCLPKKFLSIETERLKYVCELIKKSKYFIREEEIPF